MSRYMRRTREGARHTSDTHRCCVGIWCCSVPSIWRCQASPLLDAALRGSLHLHLQEPGHTTLSTVASKSDKGAPVQGLRPIVPSLCVAPFPAVTASRSPAETTLDKMDPRQRALGTLVLSHGIILHHAPDQLPRHCTVLHLAAPRVHVEPRPPDIEESSEFPRATARKDGFRQGGNVCSPPYHAPVGVRLTLAQLGRRARHRCWSDGSGSCKAPEPDCTRV
jgi:hypothetical protein